MRIDTSLLQASSRIRFGHGCWTHRFTVVCLERDLTGVLEFLDISELRGPDSFGRRCARNIREAENPVRGSDRDSGSRQFFSFVSGQMVGNKRKELTTTAI